jgi:dipeptidyl aminopeptidase/acylaminoacyl peptidase
MRSRRRLAFIAAVAAAAAGVINLLALDTIASAGEQGPAGKARRFTVRDSVEMAYFGNIRASMPDELDEDGITSPDGRWTIKVSHRGLLPEGVTEGTVWLFDARRLRAGVNDTSLDVPKPEALATVSAAANGGLGLNVLDAGNTVIAPQWSTDGRSLTFLGRNARLNRQIFEIEVASRRLTALTPPNQDVMAYSRSGSTYAYLVGPDADLQESRAWVSAGPGIPDVTIGTGTPLLPLLYPHFRGNAYSEPLRVELWKIEQGRASPVLDSRTREPVRFTTTYDATLVSLAPDALRLVSIATDGDDTAGYLKIDLETGVSTPLLDAPATKYQFRNTGRYKVVWSPAGESVAVTEVTLAGEKRCGVAIVSGGRRQVQCIADWQDESGGLVYSLRWPAIDRIDVRYKKVNDTVFSVANFRDSKSGWMRLPDGPHDSSEPLLLTVREGLNQAPVLNAIDLHTGKSRDVFDPNPQLAGIDLGDISVYEWKVPGGEVIQGLLAKPPVFDPGTRYPLVIQTHGFDDRKFFRSGYSDTSNAGRALTSRDMLVLQVREPQWNAQGTWRDAQDVGTDVYLAAIDQLSRDDLIDPTKVGISGYSYSGWLTAASITRAADRFAAAVIANSDPVTLTGYYEYVDTPLADAVVENYVGAQPYGDGLKLWFERSPSFATDRIQAPVLIQAGDPWHLISLWDVYAALRDQGKPVELQYIRGGEHNIRKPLHVLAHQELIVDWFDFWLNGHEDTQMNKSEQYARWRAMRISANRVPAAKSR